MGTRPQQQVAEVFLHYYGDNIINEMEEWSMLIHGTKPQQHVAMVYRQQQAGGGAIYTFHN